MKELYNNKVAARKTFDYLQQEEVIQRLFQEKLEKELQEKILNQQVEEHLLSTGMFSGIVVIWEKDIALVSTDITIPVKKVFLEFHRAEKAYKHANIKLNLMEKE